MPPGSRSRTFECDGTFIKRVVCRRICRQTHLWREPAQRRRKLFPAERRSQTNHHLFLQGRTAEKTCCSDVSTARDVKLEKIDGYILSPDEKKMLIQTETKPIYRVIPSPPCIFVRHCQPHPHPLVGQRPSTVAQVLTGRQSCRFRPRQ